MDRGAGSRACGKLCHTMTTTCCKCITFTTITNTWGQIHNKSFRFFLNQDLSPMVWLWIGYSKCSKKCGHQRRNRLTGGFLPFSQLIVMEAGLPRFHIDHMDCWCACYALCGQLLIQVVSIAELDTATLRRSNAGPPSGTVAQHWTDAGRLVSSLVITVWNLVKAGNCNFR